MTMGVAGVYWKIKITWMTVGDVGMTGSGRAEKRA
jgi:hypothetical protein